VTKLPVRPIMACAIEVGARRCQDESVRDDGW
jgi:hypothetical protein